MVIKLNNLEVKKGSFKLGAINYTFDNGYVYAITGNSGSGKTLLLQSILGSIDIKKEEKAITELAKDRTVLVIAHHLNTIQHADQILVFQKGKLLEKGKHQELLQKEGYYKKLWQAQDRA